MRIPSILLLALVLTNSPVAASWWSSYSNKPEYTLWDSNKLKSWLDERKINAPKGYSQKELKELVAENWDTGKVWSQEQYNQAQQVFNSIKDISFDNWDESRLRQFLLEQGVVAPSGPREKLVLAAKQHYRGYTNAASSLASTASRAASTAIYGDSTYRASASLSSVYNEATNSASSVAVQATQSLARTIDDAKDYVYSTWNENQLHDYLVNKGVLKPEEQKTHEQLLAYMRDAYAAVANPAYEAWSDSYIREWLVAHGVVKSDYENKRDSLINKMNYYFYTPQQKVYDTWSESELRNWLINHDIVKSSAQIDKRKLQRLVADNYAAASDTIWSGWKDSDLKSWLTTHGYLQSNAEAKRDEMVKLINQKYNEANARSSAYLTWPDARLRAFLRNHGLSENALPTSRPGLLQETRIRYVQTSSQLEQIYSRLRALVASGVSSVEDTLGQVLDLLSGVEHRAEHKGAKLTAYGQEKKSEAENYASETLEKIKNEL